MSFYPTWRIYPNVRNMITIANTNIFVGRKILLPPNLYPQKLPPPNVLIRAIRVNFTFCKILMSPVRFELQNFYPRSKIFELDNKYIIKCLLLKYWLIFLLVFLYLTRLKARQILSRLVKNISLYFKRRRLIIYKYSNILKLKSLH